MCINKNKYTQYYKNLQGFIVIKRFITINSETY